MKTLLKFIPDIQPPEGINQLYITEDVQKNSVFCYYSSSKIARTKSCQFVNSLVDCLNAEHNQCELIIWEGKDISDLESLSPKNPPYGWMLLSVNTPIYIHIENLSDLALYDQVNYQGVYSENSELLSQINKLF